MQQSDILRLGHEKYTDILRVKHDSFLFVEVI